ncbi:MAG: hypothetical protein GY711_08585 [bacterium]|nr:hypothetical protein [bacterium]
MTALALAGLIAGCSGGDSAGRGNSGSAQSCMTCHNGSPENDYAGPGIENPHPFAGADNLSCTTCHGGNPNGDTKEESHVPPPPEIGDDENLEHNRSAYFNRLTLTGIDKFPDYRSGGKDYTALDYLQFINPGDLRVVTEGKSCGLCHQGHAECVAGSLNATEGGVLSGAMYQAGIDNPVAASQGLFEDTLAGLGFRAVDKPGYTFDPDDVGAVGELLEFPVMSVFGETGPMQLFNNDLYSATSLPADLNPDNSIVTGSRLATLYHEMVAFTCGDCHLGSAGANNRYGDFRSSGCTSCHMAYSRSGRTGTSDPNIDRNEPLDPDDIEAPERAHVARHLIKSNAKTLPSGEFVRGIDDYSCAGCHQGSNRTVMQYWGIRLDQNQDVRRGNQYPANPVSHLRTTNDTRLFDPQIGNHTFNGRDHNQYLLEEDYDGDGRDDTPPDVHYEAGLGCIDCHGSYDLHGGDVNDPASSKIHSRMEQSVAIECESCHGGVDAYAPTVTGTGPDGEPVEYAVDGAGNPLKHVTKGSDGHFHLTSRLTGNRHFVVQTRDTVVDSGKTNPFSGDTIYSDLASYAMGTADGDPATGIGPLQSGSAPTGFRHGENMTCVACHASWTNTCIGCHLEGEYSTNNNNFSNITGERIVFREKNADFVYQSPVPFQLGVDTKGKISVMAPNTETFFKYEDKDNNDSQVFAFSDRNGAGNNRATTPFPSLSHNTMMPHSIRGKVTSQHEGPRYCSACHLTDNSLTNFGTEYTAFRTAMAANDFGSLDFNLLKDHIGKNPNNQLDSPIWVHMVAGLGSGVFLFDENGCPTNPLDDHDDRAGCDGVPPSTVWDPANVAFNLDTIVEPNGVATGSNNHPMQDPGATPNLRDGALDPNLSGPLGAALLLRLTDPGVGIVLDSWIDADGAIQGDAGDFVND